MNKKIRKICSVFTVLCMLFNIMFTEISVMALELNTEDGISEQVENVKDQSNKENVDEQTEDAKKEKESGSKEDTGKETEEMPSLEFDESIDGIQVYASSDEGIFPKGTKMNLSLVSKKDVIKTANKIVDEEVVDAVAVDITFINSEGKEIEPTDPSGVHVRIKTSNKVKGSSHEVIHISDDGKAELVGDANSTSASFKSVGFSVYAIIGTDGYTEGDTARRTYIFYYEESPNNFVEWNRQIIKNGEELVEPGIPTSPYEDSYFTGWYNGKDHESHGSQAELTFGTINDIGQTEDETVEVHAHYSKEYALIFWNRSKTDVIDTKEFNLENGTASVSLVGPTPQISGQEVHTGWIDVDTGEVYEPNASITITEERNIELKAKVEDAYKISFEGNGGTDEVTFTKPILVLPNEKGVKPADPERAGYNFTGWYKDAGCTEEFDFNEPVTDNMTLYAGWDAKQVNYDIYIWREILDNGKPFADGKKHYEIVTGYSAQALAGSTVNWANDIKGTFESSSKATSPRNESNSFDYRYYNDVTSTANTVIKGDGSTILNAYYDLKDFTVTFNIGGGTLHVGNRTYTNTYSFTAKLGEDITDKWSTDVDSYTTGGIFQTTHTFTHWDQPQSHGTTNFVTKRHFLEKEIVSTSLGVPENNSTFTASYTTRGTTRYNLNYYLETPSGDYVRSDYYSESVNTTQGTFHEKQIEGYTFNSARSYNRGNNYYFYYCLNTYDIYFHNYAELEEDTSYTGIKYGTDISSYNHTPSREAAGLPSYYEFKGWYTSRDYIDMFTFGTMPNKNIDLYANWKAKDITITFDTTGGSSIDSQTISAGEHATKPETDPTRDKYVFAGWTLDGVPVNFNNRIFTSDTTIKAEWTTNEEYYINYTTNKSEDEGKLPTDSSAYRFGSHVLIKNLDESSGLSENFLGWRIKDVPSSAVYTPGNLFSIDNAEYAQDEDGRKVITLEAFYEEHTVEPVEVTYNSNYPNGEENDTIVVDKNSAGEDLKQNEEIITKGADVFTYPGYTITSWNTKADGTGKTVNFDLSIAADHNGENTLYAIWAPKQDTKYTITHYIECTENETSCTKTVGDKTYKVLSTYNRTGQTDTEGRATSGTFTGVQINKDNTRSNAEANSITYQESGNQVILTGNIKGDESTNFEFFYDRAEYTVSYRVQGYMPTTFDQSTIPSDSTHKYQEEVSVENLVSAEGYTFNGWYLILDGVQAKYVEGDTFVMPGNNVILYGSFVPETNASNYLVKHYMQIANDPKTGVDDDINIIDGKSFELPTSNIFTYQGTALETASIAPREFTGFHTTWIVTQQAKENIDHHNVVDSENNVVNGTILGDDSLIIAVYYERNEHIVTYEYEGAVPNGASELLPSSSTKSYGDTVTIEPDVILPGYTFTGWYTEDETINKDTTSFEMPDNNITLLGRFEANDTAYKVEHYTEKLDGTFELKDTEDKTAKTDTEVSATPKTYSGFTYDSSIDGTKTTGTVVADGSLVLKLFYTRDSYNVNYAYEGEVPNGADELLPEDDTDYLYESEVTVKPDVNLPGYTFTGWHSEDGSVTDTDSTFEMPAKDVTLYGSFEANTDVTYTIEHYLQNTDGTTYKTPTVLNGTLEEKQDGVTGETVTASPKTFEGFTFERDNPNNKVSGEVTVDENGNGTLVLKLYYERDKYTVHYNYYGNVPASASPLPSENKYYFEEVVPVAPDAFAPGYTFIGWDTREGSTLDIENDEFEMPARDVYLRGTFEANEDTAYKIEHYIQKLDKTFELKETENKTAKTDTEVSATPKTYSGFTFDNSVEGTRLTGLVAGDGSLVLKLFYIRDSYNVSYAYEGEVPNGADELLPEDNTDYLYESEVTVKDDVNLPGYTFTGWHSEDGSVTDTDSTFEMPAKDVTLYGSFEANTDTEYKVNYYYQKEDGTYSNDPNSSVTRTGTTDTNVSVTDDDKKPDSDHSTYVFDSSQNSNLSGNIKGDGSLELRVYFKNQFTVTYNDGVDSEELFEDQITNGLDYNSDTPEFDGILERLGYVFNGWSPKVTNKVTKNVIYKATWKKCSPAQADPPVKKRIIGDTPSKNVTFKFTLTAISTTADIDKMPMPKGSNGNSKTVSILGAGEYEFGIIKFTEIGTYIYRITEENTNESGYGYDNSEYIVTYEVTQKGDRLVANRTITRDGEPVSDVIFDNTYKLPVKPINVINKISNKPIKKIDNKKHVRIDIVNPYTKDNIIYYFVLFTISLLGLGIIQLKRYSYNK